MSQGELMITSGTASGIVSIQGTGNGKTYPGLQRVQIELEHNESIGGLTGTAYGKSVEGISLRIDAMVSANEVKRVHSGGAAASPAYVAVGRRRAFSELRKLVLGLADHRSKDDFHSYTFPIASAARRELTKLMAHEQVEGNACIILRYLRNSFMGRESNDRYRDPEVSVAVAEALQTPATANAVSFAYTRTVFRKFESLHLRTMPPMTWATSKEDDTERDEESQEEKVSG